jgi:hypothetical protein
MEDKGFVYILKDSHFKRGVKIGRAHDVDKRMRPMLTANPWLSVYIKVETSKWKELEKAVHNVIKLVAKTKQVKNSEFYLIEPEKAKKIMLEFAPLFDKDDFTIYLGDGTKVCAPSTESEARVKATRQHPSKPASLSELGIKPNDKLVFIPTGLVVAVVDDKTIEYKGTRYSLSGFTKEFIPRRNASGAYQGPKYFSYNGKSLLEIRNEHNPSSGGSGERWEGKTQLAKLIARRGGNEGAFGGILHYFSRMRPCGKASKWRTILESAGIKFDANDCVIDWAVAKNPL